MSDAMALSDVVASTASAAILDPLYEGRPTGVCRNESQKFEMQPQIAQPDDLDRLMQQGFTPGTQAVVDRYDDVDANIERICEGVEAFTADRVRQ